MNDSILPSFLQRRETYIRCINCLKTSVRKYSSRSSQGPNCKGKLRKKQERKFTKIIENMRHSSIGPEELSHYNRMDMAH